MLALQGSCIRRQRIVVDAFDLATNAHLLFELHHRQEEVAIVVKQCVQTVEQVQLTRRVIAVVANGATHNGPVLLLDVGVVVATACPASGEGDLFLDAVTVELVVDELGTVVGVDAQQGERQALPCLLDGCKDMDLSLVGCSHAFCPSCMDICKTECPGVVLSTDDDTAAVIDQVDFTESRLVFCPVCPGANGDLILEQRAGFGEPSPLSRPMLALTTETIHR
jgi:hypothetical protein